VHRWLLDPGSIYKSTSARLADASMQQRLVARAADLGKHWPELPVARKRALLAALIERIEVSLDQIDIRLRPPRLGVLLDVAAAPSQGVKDDETEILSVPVRLRRAGREIRMVIDRTDPFAAAKRDARLIKLLLRARQFNATLAEGEGVPLRHSPSGKGSAGLISRGSSASATSRRILPNPSSRGGNRAI
jgi:hypothetical protein